MFLSLSSLKVETLYLWLIEEERNQTYKKFKTKRKHPSQKNFNPFSVSVSDSRLSKLTKKRVFGSLEGVELWGQYVLCYLIICTLDLEPHSSSTFNDLARVFFPICNTNTFLSPLVIFLCFEPPVFLFSSFNLL